VTNPANALLIEEHPSRHNILGVGVSAINMQDALTIINGWVERREPNYVCVTPAHAVMDCQRDVNVRRVYNQAGMVTPDGMAIVWLLKLAGFSNVSRVYGPDLLREVCAESLKHGWRHYFFGGAPQVTRELVARLQRDYPGLQVAGWDSPAFENFAAEEQAALTRMAEARADLIWVALGSPRQEVWMAQNLHQIGCVMVGVGAAFDFLSGFKSQAPRWMQKAGLEWLFRLFSEPRRLWRRYFLYPHFIILVFLQRLGLKNYSIDSD
jgi:N-acetylglucosaminyldiphosphoundecaprenol N-acetyl-beta-D-mannosaminyltransferase